MLIGFTWRSWHEGMVTNPSPSSGLIVRNEPSMRYTPTIASNITQVECVKPIQLSQWANTVRIPFNLSWHIIQTIILNYLLNYDFITCIVYSYLIFVSLKPFREEGSVFGQLAQRHRSWSFWELISCNLECAVLSGVTDRRTRTVFRHCGDSSAFSLTAS